MTKKYTYYFSHDFNARSDEKIIHMRMRHGPAGYGIYWMLIEKLADTEGHKLKCDYAALAFDMRADEAMVKSVVEDFELFVIIAEEEVFYSHSLLERLNGMDAIKEKRAAAGRLGGLARKKHQESNAKANESNAKANASENGSKCLANASENGSKCFNQPKNEGDGEGDEKLKELTIEANASENGSKCLANATENGSKIKENKINNNIIVDDDKARAREEESSLKREGGDTLVIDIEQLYKEYRATLSEESETGNSMIRYYKNMYKYDITREDLARWLDMFQDSKRMLDEKFDTLSSYRKHFANWLRIQIEIKIKNGQKNGTANNNRGANSASERLKVQRPANTDFIVKI